MKRQELFTDGPSGCCIDRYTGRVVAVFKPCEDEPREVREDTAKRKAEEAMAETAVHRLRAA